VYPLLETLEKHRAHHRDDIIWYYAFHWNVKERAIDEIDAVHTTLSILSLMA
jgi:hypothetical protein